MNNRDLIAALEQSIAGLAYLSESDYPFEVVVWEKPKQETPETIAGLAGEASGEYDTQTLDDFFTPLIAERDEMTDAARAISVRFQELLKLLRANLKQPCVYRYGTRNIGIYIVGATEDDKLIGLKTRAVET